MFLRRATAARAFLPGRIAVKQRNAALRCLCTAGSVADGDGEHRDSAFGQNAKSERFSAGKSILMEMFPGRGEPNCKDIHEGRSSLYSSLKRWEASQDRAPEEVLDVLYALPTRYYPPFAQFVQDRNLLPKVSLDDVKALVRNHPRRPCTPLTMPLLNACIVRLTEEASDLSTVDAALILMSLSYINNVDYGKLLGAFTTKLLNDVEGIPLKMMASVVEMLSRKRLLDRRFSSGILTYIEEHAAEMELADLVHCANSFSFSRQLLTNHALLVSVDRRLSEEADKITDSTLGTAVNLFRFNGFRAKRCVEILTGTLTDPDREAACSHQTFALLANYLCLQLNNSDEAVLKAIRSGVVTRKSFDPRELMLIAGVLSHLQLVSYNAPTSPLEDIVSVLEPQIPKLHASQLVSLLLEMKKVEVLSGRLVESVLNRALETSDELKVDDAVRLIHGAARVLRKKNPKTAVGLMWKLAPQIAVQVPHMQPKLLSMTCMAMNMLAVKHPLLCTAIAERGYKMLSSTTPDIYTLSSLASSLARVDFPAVDFFVELHRLLESDMLPVASQQHLVRLVWACVAQGIVPRTTLQNRVFSKASAPTGDEELSYLQMLRDLFIISVYDGIFKVVAAQSKVLQSLFASISAKQMRYESRPEFADLLATILGEGCILSGGLTVESISVPAAMLFNPEDGKPVPWSDVGVEKNAMLPQPRSLKEKHSVRAVALVSPSVIYPDRSPSGQTKMMCRILRYSGWHVGLVPLHQWEAQPDRAAKMDLLKEILVDTLTRPAEGDEEPEADATD